MGRVRTSRQRTALGLLSGLGLLSPPLAGLLLVLACTPEDEPPPSDGGGGEPPSMMPLEVPTSACGDFVLVGCDAACSDSKPCPPGLYCTTAGVCGANCQDDDDCSGSDECKEGRCFAVSNIILDPLETDPDKPPDVIPECIEGQVEFEAVVPEVSLLLDRSGSMSSGLGTVSRWTALGLVLLGDPADVEDRGVVGDFEDRVAFGASFYTSGSGGPTGCILDMESVAIARNNYKEIRQRYSQIGPTGGTPTGEAVRAVVANSLASDLSGGPKILVLATDGEPGTCGETSELPTTFVENEVAAAFDDGMKTFAISIDTGTNLTHMQRVANLGVGLAADADPPAPYFTAETQEELALAFATILEELPRSCVFSLNGEVDPAKAEEGTVVLAGEDLTYEDPDGWVLPQVDQVELVGASCDQIRAGEEDLDISFPCSVFTPVVK